MSRAVTANTVKLRDVYQALKSACIAANTTVSNLFNATDLYIKQMQEMDRYIYRSRDMALSCVYDVPLGGKLPPVTGLPPFMIADGVMNRDRQEPVVRPALSSPQVLALPEGNSQSGQDRPEEDLDDVQLLMTLLRAKTNGSYRAEALPSGAVKITLDEYFMGTNRREPEFASVRR